MLPVISIRCPIAIRWINENLSILLCFLYHLVPGWLRGLKLNMSRTEFFPSPICCSSLRLSHLPNDSNSVQKYGCHPAYLLPPLPSPSLHGQLITKTCWVGLSPKMAPNYTSPSGKGMLTIRQGIELNHMPKNEARPLLHSIYTASWTSHDWCLCVSTQPSHL